jgi:hypothetical protein
MLDRTHSIHLLLLLAIVGCGDDHKGDDTTTHGATHEGGAETTGDAVTTSGSSGSDGTTAAAVEPPAAPTDLTASLLEGGAHLNWKDASDDEDNFILEKKAAGDADFSMVIELPFDSVTYHDNDVIAATMYTYRVKAINAAGESISNEAMIQIP